VRGVWCCALGNSCCVVCVCVCVCVRMCGGCLLTRCCSRPAPANQRQQHMQRGSSSEVRMAQRQYDVIVNMLTSRYQQPTTGQQLRSEIPQALTRIAIGLQDSSTRRTRKQFLLRLVRLFVHLGQMALSMKMRLKDNPYVVAAGRLLPAMAEAHGGIRDIDDWTWAREKPDTVKLYRTLWNFLTLFRFAYPDSPHVESCFRLALATPVLVLKRSTALQLELASNVAAQGDASHYLQLRTDMRQLLPSEAVHLRALSDPDLLFVAAVYFLETLRARSDTFKAVFIYLGNSSVENAQGHLSSAVTGIVRAVFDVFTQRMEVLGRTASREEVLEDHCLFTVTACCHRFKRIRGAATEFLGKMLGLFPQLLFNSSCAFTLLDAMDAITQRSCMGYDLNRSQFWELHLRAAPDAAADQFLSTVDESAPIELLDCHYRLEAPAGRTKLSAIATDLEALVMTWIRRAAELQPHETQSLLQRFARRLALHHAHRGPQAHAGITAALKAATSTQDHGFGITAAAMIGATGGVEGAAGHGGSTAGSAFPVINESTNITAAGLPSFVASSDIRAHYLGEIDGMRVCALGCGCGCGCGYGCGCGCVVVLGSQRRVPPPPARDVAVHVDVGVGMLTAHRRSIASLVGAVSPPLWKSWCLTCAAVLTSCLTNAWGCLWMRWIRIATALKPSFQTWTLMWGLVRRRRRAHMTQTRTFCWWMWCRGVV